MKNELVHITDRLNSLYRVDISTYDLSFLNKAISSRMLCNHCGSLSEYSDLLENKPEEEKIFLDSLNISYSEFFRNTLTFSVLEHIVLPGLVHQKKTKGNKEIRIWSAACASGQETYSIAMLLEELQSKSDEVINYRIFATDHAENQIEEAQKACYTGATLNNLTDIRLKKWFAIQGDFYSVIPELKKHIDFSVFDLFSEMLDCPPVSIFGDFDIVFCANLLFYYKKADQKIILNKTGNCLKKTGFLITGEAERDILFRNNFQEVYQQSAIFRKPG
jgi:chemotaxis methyl-accepting protein methylase